MAEISLTNVKLGVSNKTNYDAINNNFAELQSKKLNTDGKAASAANADKVNNLTVETAVPANVVFFTDEEKKALLTEEEAKYRNETPIITAIGGIKVGETFKGLTIQQMFDKLLYPYVKPKAEIAVTPSGGVFEKGTSTQVTTLNVTATKKSRDIKQIEAKKNDSESLAVVTEGVANGGTFSCLPAEGLTINADTTIKGYVTDTDNGVTTTGAVTFTFVDPFFYGVVAPGTEVTSEMVLGLTKDVKQKDNKTYTYTTNNQCMVIAYPASYGNLTKALDPNNFENIGSYTKSTINVNVTSGAVSYNVYVKEPSTAQGFKIAYSF